MIAILVFLLAAIGLTIKGFIVKKEGDICKGDGWCGCAIACWFGFIVVAVVFGSTYTSSLNNYARLVTYQEIMPEYEVTLQRTQQALILSADELGSIQVENLQHSSRLAERIVEIRDYIRWYKETLRRYRYYNDRWFLRQWIAKMPEELQGGNR